jgi:hypothetical protein
MPKKFRKIFYGIMVFLLIAQWPVWVFAQLEETWPTLTETENSSPAEETGEEQTTPPTQEVLEPSTQIEEYDPVQILQDPLMEIFTPKSSIWEGEISIQCTETFTRETPTFTIVKVAEGFKVTTNGTVSATCLSNSRKTPAGIGIEWDTDLEPRDEAPLTVVDNSFSYTRNREHIYPTAGVYTLTIKVYHQGWKWKWQTDNMVITEEIDLQDNDNDGDPNETDCAINDPAIHHWAFEICDGVDNNCDGNIDEGDVCTSISEVACGWTLPENTVVNTPWSKTTFTQTNGLPALWIGCITPH